MLPPFCLFDYRGKTVQFLEGMERHLAPLNDWLHAVLRQTVKRLIPDDIRYTLTFDKLEILIALGYAHHAKCAQGNYWFPLGAFGYRRQNCEQFLREIEESITQLQSQSPFVKSGIFGNTAESCLQQIAAFRDFVGKIPWH